MNLVLFEPHELINGQLRLTGRRAEHLRNVMHVSLGETVRLGEIGGSAGVATVHDIADDAVTLVVDLNAHRDLSAASNLACAEVELILALPRPQMLKRTLQNVAGLGISKLYLIGSGRVERSFFSSSALAEDQIRHHLTLGLEQGIQTRLPAVSIHPRFKFFGQEVLAALPETYDKFIAHPSSTISLAEVFRQPAENKANGSKTIFAIGPEGGWLDGEVETFGTFGFKSFSLGESIYRVETAVVAALSQYELLRRMHRDTN